MPKKHQLNDFFIGKTIGEGAFSKVKLGIHKESGTKVAIKIIDKATIEEMAEKARKQCRKQASKDKNDYSANIESNSQPSYLSSIQLEVQLLMRLDHPNVIKLYQMVENEDECYVVM